LRERSWTWVEREELDVGGERGAGGGWRERSWRWVERAGALAGPRQCT